MESNGPRDRAPELVVEKLALGEASAEQTQRATPADLARAAALRVENAEILARYPAHQLAVQIRHRAAQRRPAARRWLWVPALATAAGVVLIVAGPLRPGERGSDGPGVSARPDEVRLKGSGPRLLVFRKQGEQAAQLRPGSEAQAGDLIQLGYLASGQRYGVIVSVDARGGATLHFPAAPEAPVELQRGGPTLLAQAFQLDDAPAFERFFLVTTDEAHRTALTAALVLDMARVLAADPHAAETQPLRLPPGLHQESFLLRKRARQLQ